ncbi:TPA: hypothetical protein N0F65_003487 [Lagenidium giganteum]|uniref:C2H2-type domain-containing protein n=1 Tax=Lagenidium giganteum TaxID=4803 RepID=A0AAV2YB58_9STRA|nr:TPA: hypothetical protein N0F65_003487 [Lagenidium giganteum]
MGVMRAPASQLGMMAAPDATETGNGSQRRATMVGDAVPVSAVASAASAVAAGDGRKVYRCMFPGCGKEFHLKGNLKRHENIHSGEKKFRCTFCGREFLRKADMEVHHRVHTGEKPYRCRHDGCNKCFARQSDLLSHERTHTYVGAYIRLQQLNLYELSSHSPCPLVLIDTAETSPLNASIMADENAYTGPCCSSHLVTKIPSPKSEMPSYQPMQQPPPTSMSSMLVPMDMSGAVHFRQLPASSMRSSQSDGGVSSIADVQRLQPPPPLQQQQHEHQHQHQHHHHHHNHNHQHHHQLSASQPPMQGVSPSCASEPAQLHDYRAHNPSCGHLSIHHGNHLDYVVNNHVVCQTSVRSISVGGAVARQPGVEKCDDAHRPGCGHLPVRHHDHIDYVVEDNLLCQHAGLADTKPGCIEMLDDDFWEFYGAIGSFAND